MAPSVNLIPMPRLQAQARRRRIRAWAATVAVYAGVVGAGCAWSLVSLVDGGARERAALEGLQERVERLEEERAAKRAELADAGATLRANLVVTLEPDWSVLMGLVADALGRDAALSGFRLLPPAEAGDAGAGDESGGEGGGRYVVMVSGRSRSQGGVSAFVLRLEELGLFDQVTLVESRREEEGSRELVGFDIRCEIDAPTEEAR